MTERLIAGAMSGTSADGVDVAIVAIAGCGLDMTAKLIRHTHYDYAPELRRSIFSLRERTDCSLRMLAQCGREIAGSYAQAVQGALSQAGLIARDLTAVAAHGQTIFHEPPDTIQWIDPAFLAAKINCAVISDFRRADCAAGGQGAPLVPFADYILFGDLEHYRILLNIGGIANVTLLPPGRRFDQITALDTGPGNCISDWICRTYGPRELSWDVDGRGASGGAVLRDVADRFLADSFFAASSPKSTDGPAMIAAFDKAMGGAKYAMDDLLATAAHLTARTIVEAIKPQLSSGGGFQLIASGGGIHNQAIMGWLRSLLPSNVEIRTTDAFNIPSAAKEAIAFALLGAATLDNIPANVPSCTGASRAVVLGSITPRP